MFFREESSCRVRTPPPPLLHSEFAQSFICSGHPISPNPSSVYPTTLSQLTSPSSSRCRHFFTINSTTDLLLFGSRVPKARTSLDVTLSGGEVLLYLYHTKSPVSYHSVPSLILLYSSQSFRLGINNTSTTFETIPQA